MNLSKIYRNIQWFYDIFLWHWSEDVNKKALFPNFQLIPILRLQVCMIMCIGTAP